MVRLLQLLLPEVSSPGCQGHAGFISGLH